MNSSASEQAQVDVQPKSVCDPLAQEFADTVAKPCSSFGAYGQQVKQVREDRLIVQFLPLVHKIVNQVATYLQPPFTKEDLVSAGTIGLVKAARDFDPTKDAEFKTYAYIRVRGAVIDELRSWSFTPTTAKKQYEHVQQLSRDILRETGQIPTDEELAEGMGVTVEKIYQIFEHARAKHFMSIHGLDDDAPALGDMLVCEHSAKPGDRIEQEELVAALAKAIETLPEKQKHIVILYYQKELTMKQVSEVLEVTESRVSQLHASALFKLSVQLKNWTGQKSDQ